jgi:ketosteroid isomerase-like protein
MRIVLGLLIALWAGAAHAQTGEDRMSIQSVITAQLEAFQHDDAGAAFEKASPMIQQLFGTPDNFIAMVQKGYPPVYRPRGSSFAGLEDGDDGQLIQKVELTGPDGRDYLALYIMQKQPDGSWKINGCQLTESEKVGV